MFCLLLRSEIQNTCQFLCGLAVCSLGFECERAKYITFSFFASYFSLQSRSQRYHLAGQHYAWRGGTSKKERDSGLDLCYHFRPYFLDLSFPKIPRKFQELHLFLTPFEKWKKCYLLSTLFFGLHNSNGFTSGALIIFFRSSSCLPAFTSSFNNDVIGRHVSLQIRI